MAPAPEIAPSGTVLIELELLQGAALHNVNTGSCLDTAAPHTIGMTQRINPGSWSRKVTKTQIS